MKKCDKDLYFNYIEIVPSHIEARQELERKERGKSNRSIAAVGERVDQGVGDSVGKSARGN